MECKLRPAMKKLLGQLESEVKTLKKYLRKPGWNQDKLVEAIKARENFILDIKNILTPFVEIVI